MKGKYPKDFKWTGWHPNDLCYVIPIIKTEEQFWLPKEERGKDNAEITDVPQGFKTWVANNQDRIARAEKRGTLPYFVRDNRERVFSKAKYVNKETDDSKPVNKLKEFHDAKDFREAQKHLSRQKYEKIVVLNASGRKLFEIQGKSAEVEFTDEQGLKMKDKIVLHNHPYGMNFPENDLRRIGHSLSSADVYSAVKFNMNAIVAISPKFRYELIRPSKGWGVNSEDIKKEYNKIYIDLMTMYKNQLQGNRKIILQHLTMKNLAQKFGLEYKSIKR